LHTSTRESALLCRVRVVHVMIHGGKTFCFFAPFLNVLCLFSKTAFFLL